MKTTISTIRNGIQLSFTAQLEDLDFFDDSVFLSNTQKRMPYI